MTSADILIVDDENDIRALIQGILQDEGYATRQAANAEQAYAQLKAGAPDLVVLDIWLQNSSHDGLEILASIKDEYPNVPVLMISGHGTIETAVSAIKMGAYDFIEKPFKADRLLLMIERALETAKLRLENKRLRDRANGPSDLVGGSQVMLALSQVLKRVAQTNSRVLITGEPGTGKDIVARMIHRLSQRAEGPFRSLNCAILNPENLEAELFGAAGSPGVLEKANGGTLLLDEVADMPLETQAKIVRVLQDQRFQRPGGQDEIEVNVRVLASSNRDLQEAMNGGSFRQDLFYRLNVVPVQLPPLRDRPQDIPQLVEHFTRIYSEQSSIPPCRFSDAALAAMQAYEWPGNVRQLRNAIEWTMIMNGANGGEAIRPDQLPPEVSELPPKSNGGHANHDMMALPLRDAREVFEKTYLESQIRRFGGNISRTAQFVGMERSALHRKMKQLGICPPGRGDEAEGEEPVQDNRKRA
jgi:two-component system nitrogen regulation response regulator NtrX